RDAEMTGGQRRRRMHELAVEMHFPRVRRVDAGENFAERALARAVLTHQRMATAPFHCEAHAIQREHAGEPLRDPVEFQEWHFLPISAATSPSFWRMLRGCSWSQGRVR